MRKTKIVATLGPASDSPETILKLLTNGVDVVRFNTKHADPVWHKERIERVRSIGLEYNIPVSIFVDLQGPEIRIETLDKVPVMVSKDEEFVFAFDFIDGIKSVKVPTKEVFAGLKAGDSVMLNDGYQEFKVIEVQPDQMLVKALDDYEIGHRKGMNLPGIDVALPSLAERDFDFLTMVEDLGGVDFIGLSFVRRKSDVDILRQELIKRKINTHIISKVEGAHAVEAIDEIIEASDAIMVARGDLGVEMPIEQVTYLQKMIIRKCRLAAKPVITATEMLESMHDRSRPTRAEVSDVANAVFDGTDAVMLSGETANGQFPVQAVAMMARIAKFNEEKNGIPQLDLDLNLDQSKAITHAVMDLVRLHKDFDIDAVVVFTQTGRTVRELARFHPHTPVIAISEDVRVCNQLALVYGVTAFRMNLPEGEIVETESVARLLSREGVISPGQRVVFVHGNRWRVPGLTNTISIREIV